MKKILSIILATALCTSLITACSQDVSDETSVETETEQVVPDRGATSEAPEFTDDMHNLFDAGMEGLTGVGYEALIYLGTPESNPLGSSFLCRATMVVPDPVPYWAIVTMQDVGDSVTIESIQTIDYGSSSTGNSAVLAESSRDAVLGSWTDTESLDVPDEISAVVPNATAVLATQLVSGTNYCVLTWADGWNLTFVYVDLDGNAEVTNTVSLSL